MLVVWDGGNRISTNSERVRAILCLLWPRRRGSWGFHHLERTRDMPGDEDEGSSTEVGLEFDDSIEIARNPGGGPIINGGCQRGINKSPR